MNEQDLALEHYSALQDVNTLMRRDVTTLWRNVEKSNSLDALAALLETVPAIGEVYGDMAASLATDYYESAREIADVPGVFVATPADLPDARRFESLTRWATDPLNAPDPQPDAVAARLEGGLQRVVANASRETVVKNTARDKKSSGWKRITRDGGGCTMCKMLAGRGPVYAVGSRFATHDHCRCVCGPAFGPESDSPPLSAQQYRASKIHQSGADKARLRSYLKKLRAAEKR